MVKFISRIETKTKQDRLNFMFSKEANNMAFKDAVLQFIGYAPEKSNVTILDLSGIPFEVLSITVSLISRLLFDFGYYFKRNRIEKNPNEKLNSDVPILLVFEEAHKYAPKSGLARFKHSLKAIERIAKEGRKYGITLMLSSQRPSEISETIFSQCNNFISMRLTNPNDQNYVARLLPDTLGSLIDCLPSLQAGEALLIGDAIVMPSIVQIEQTDLPPSSNDIPYWELWKEKWKTFDFGEISKNWNK